MASTLAGATRNPVLPIMSKASLDAARGIVLAAGYSSRMRGPVKALLPLGQGSMLGMAVAALRGGDVLDICVVTGHEPEAITREVRSHGATPVYNPDFARGMFTSIRAGLSFFSQNSALCSGPVLLLPVDAALVRAQSVSTLCRAWKHLALEHQPGAVIIPSFHGQPGHPLLLGPAHIAAILRDEWSGGLRHYLASLLAPEAAERFLTGLSMTHRPLEDRPVPAAAGRTKKQDAFLFTTGQDSAQTRSSRSATSAPFMLVEAAAKDLRQPVSFLSLPDCGIISDMDTPNEYAQANALLALTGNRQSPTPAEAWEWLRHSGLDRRKIRHCLMVALGALRLGLALAVQGKKADPRLHVCAGMLHDIAHARRNHARVGQALISSLEWLDCAVVVGAHTVLPDSCLAALDINMPASSPKTTCRPRKDEREQCVNGIPESGVADSPALLHACACVYMADKFFYGDTQVPLHERFDVVKRRFADDAKALEAICHRERIAFAVRGWFENVLGAEPERILERQEAHPLEDMLQRLLPVPEEERFPGNFELGQY